MKTFKIASKSDPNRIARAIAGVLREQKEPALELQAVGAAAVNQAVKAVAIARGFLAPSGIDLICRPAFVDLEVEQELKTAIRLRLEGR